MLTSVHAECMRRDFADFAKAAWHVVEPKICRWNWHMDAMAEHLVNVTQGDIRNLVIMVPPRMTKSLLCTVLWPVWHWLQLPQTQFITASYVSSLSEEHSQLSRRVIQSGWFKQHYGNEFFLLHDENRKDMYRNSEGGYRLTTSVDGRATGEGGDIQVLDDPHNAKDVESDVKRQGALEWHDNSWRSRVNDPNNAQKVYIAQRTHDNDILGHVLQKEPQRWTQLLLPMEFDPKRKCITYANPRGRGPELNRKIFEDPRKKEGELLNPKRFDAETAKVEKTSGMSTRAWNAQYQQQPEGQGGLILKRNWWQPWVYPDWHTMAGKERKLPEFTEIITVLDTAFSEEEEENGDFTAATTWGIFPYLEELRLPNGKLATGAQRFCAILIDAVEERLGFPELRELCIDLDQTYAPDVMLIEKKASGASLVQELRRKKIPVRAYKIDGAGDLVARAHESSLMLEKGCIFYVPRQKFFHVIEECAKFPVAPHDDLVSSCTMAWMYMRRYYDLQLPDDDKPMGDINPFKWQRTRRYA